MTITCISKEFSAKIPTVSNRGFALVATIFVMVLLLMVALAMLGLSTIELRSSRNGLIQGQAEANARLALMLALGELQKEMGPDLRISAEAALFDNNKNSPEIDGVDQSRWLASYNAWGGWLNGEYAVTEVDGSTGDSMRIRDTYADKRELMFRRWLVSLPAGSETDVDAPLNGGGLTQSNSVILVGEGSLGEANDLPDGQITRGYLQNIEESGKFAWWIGPENHKAKAPLADNERALSTSEWETAQGGTAEVGVSEIDGFDGLRSAGDQAKKLITQNSIRLAAGVDEEIAKKHFFDLTTHSRGILTNARLGGLKQDLSLLFELTNTNLPQKYSFAANDVREPSIRPMSPDLRSQNPKEPNRHFASWTNMRHYYRIYKSSSDASAGGTNGGGNLKWTRAKPQTDVMTNLFVGWNGSNNYQRVPLLSKLTFIYSLQSVEIPNSNPKKYNCDLVYSPIYTFWNPYNVELRLPNRSLTTLSMPYKILPLNYYSYLNGVQNGGIRSVAQDLKQEFGSYFNAGGSGDIIFKPGEMKLFSYRSNGTSDGKQTDFYPGFDPQAIGGDKLRIHSNVAASQNPGMAITFGNPSAGGGNVWFGNTPGGLNNPFAWEHPSNYTWLLASYQHDWLRPSEANTRITPRGSSNVAHWLFSDSDPVPFAYNQFVLKTSSEFEYESITWEKDWRCKNWMQAPGYYFGSAQFISSEESIANTQRTDNPYVFHFGPMSSADMPKVVPHIGENTFIGSGSNPREKITAAPMLELPSAPLSSLAAFSNMRINPGWTHENQFSKSISGNVPPWNSLSNFAAKALVYQSGITGPAIGNSFLHPMLPRDGVYRYFDNSKSHDVSAWMSGTTERDNQMFNDFWDHTLLINDSLWDDYFVSTLSDVTRPSAGSGNSMGQTIDTLLSDGAAPSYSRYQLYKQSKKTPEIKQELLAEDGYLKVAQYLMVDGMFNVNSTSVDAWFALFAGIRERKVVYRDNSGQLDEVDVPSGKLIALSRFNTATTNQEMDDAESGVTRSDGQRAWSGIRFLDDEQLKKLAEECVKQVKLRGPFLNLSEFINRRLSDDDLGTMGALQSAIDYDDSSPDPQSINYRFKRSSDAMIGSGELGSVHYATPEAATGSRFTGVPGYVIQTDLLKPISNTLNVRDDTFRIRAYGEVKDSQNRVIARAWCEAIVQRYPDYVDATNAPHVSARKIDAQGTISNNPELSDLNKKWGRKFRVKSFRWLNQDEV